MLSSRIILSSSTQVSRVDTMAPAYAGVIVIAGRCKGENRIAAYSARRQEFNSIDSTLHIVMAN